MTESMKAWAINFLTNPIAMNGAIFILSVTALTAALIAEFAFGLEPCSLCIIQRWPYGIAALLGVTGLATLYKEEWAPVSVYPIIAASAVFAAGGLIAFYHVGVEQHWWASAIEGCKVDFESGSIEELKNIMDNKPAARCDQVAWSMLGISMAGYNVLLSFALAAGCAISAILIKRRENGLL